MTWLELTSIAIVTAAQTCCHRFPQIDRSGGRLEIVSVMVNTSYFALVAVISTGTPLSVIFAASPK